MAFLIGMGAFAFFVLVCLFGLLPRGGWNFDLDAEAVLKRSDPMGANLSSMDAVHSDLALWLDYFYFENEKLLGKLFWGMFVAAVALLVEFVAFFYVLAI